MKLYISLGFECEISSGLRDSRLYLVTLKYKISNTQNLHSQILNNF